MSSKEFHSIPIDHDFHHTDNQGRCFIHRSDELDERGFLSRVWSRLKASGRLLKYISPSESVGDQIALYSSYYPDAGIHLDDFGRGGSLVEERGLPFLCVMFHGLGGRPSEWEPLMNLIESELPETAFYAPEVVLDTLEERQNSATYAVLALDAWFKKYPNGTVMILAYSAGVCVAAEFEMLLRKRKISSCFIGVAGLFYGSRWINFFKSTRWIVSRTLEGHHVGNAGSRSLIQRMRTNEEEVYSSFFFIVSTEDERIVPWTGGAPCIGREKVYVLHDKLHFEVLHAASDIIIDIWKNYIMERGGIDPRDDIDELSDDSDEND